MRLRVMLLEETMSSEEARGGERGREGSQQGDVVKFLRALLLLIPAFKVGYSR